MFIKLKYLKALIWGSKEREGRMGREGGYISKIIKGQDMFFQTWTLLAWWMVTRVCKYNCASEMLECEGYKLFIPEATTQNEALRVYYLCDPENKKRKPEFVTIKEILDWDKGIREDDTMNFYSMSGITRRLKWTVSLSLIKNSQCHNTHTHTHTSHIYTYTHTHAHMHRCTHSDTRKPYANTRL